MQFCVICRAYLYLDTLILVLFTLKNQIAIFKKKKN